MKKYLYAAVVMAMVPAAANATLLSGEVSIEELKADSMGLTVFYGASSNCHLPTGAANYQVIAGEILSSYFSGTTISFDYTGSCTITAVQTTQNGAVVGSYTGDVTVDGSVTATGGYFYADNVNSDKKFRSSRTGGSTWSLEHDSSQLYLWDETSTRVGMRLSHTGVFSAYYQGSEVFQTGTYGAGIFGAPDLSPWSGSARGLHVKYNGYPTVRLEALSGSGSSLYMSSGFNESYLEHVGSGNIYLRQNGTPAIAITTANATHVYGDLYATSIRARTGSYVNAINHWYFNNHEIYGVAKFKLHSGTAIKNVTSTYGSVQTEGSTNGWGGYNVNGQHVFMSNGTTMGMYDDTNNQWMVRSINSGTTELYYNGVGKLETTSSGVTIVGSFTEVSDARYKSNISPLEGSLDRITAYQGVSHEWSAEGFPDGRYKGLIAQEVREVDPSLVVEDDDGMLSVDYTKIIPDLIEAVKILSERNEALAARIKELESER